MGTAQSAEQHRKTESGDQLQRGVSQEPKTTLKVKRPSKIFRRNMSVPPPITDPDDVERRFEEILKKMDLPVNKAKVLRNYDLQKKWKVVCDQEKVSDKGSPVVYLDKLRVYIDPKGTKKKRKTLNEETSTLVLKHLEISLRTNTIDWVREFLNEKNNGLEVLVNYLKLMQAAGGLQSPPHLAACDGRSTLPRSNQDFGSVKKMTLSRKSSSPTKYDRTLFEDDIHVCIQCLRAVMNSTYGFNMVFNDKEAIDCIVRSILHPSLRTKTSVLVLLAAICLVKGGHELVLGSFDRFKKEYQEDARFQTFFHYFRHYDEFHVDFMVGCMQFINILVHSVDDMNYRLFLQTEFKVLGLDDYLEKLKTNESEELQVQIRAYLENMYDVSQLIEDTEQRLILQQRVDHLQMELSRANEKLQEVEIGYMTRIGDLDYRLAELIKERENLLSVHQSTDNDLNTMRKALLKKDQEAHLEQNRLESRIHELEELQKSFRKGLPSVSSINENVVVLSPKSPTPMSPSGKKPVPVPPPAPPPPSTIPPPPPPPLLGKNAPPAPNFSTDPNVMTIKKKIQTKYKLPILNWSALKPNQLKGTVFGELDDETILNTINFDDFEETFKIGVNVIPNNATPPLEKNTLVSHSKKQTATSLLDNKRIRNVAITKRKLAMEPTAVMRAVNQFDLKALELENVEILLHILPTPEEAKVFKDYETSRKSVDDLSPEDQFMIQLAKIERLPQKLQIMSFMGNFGETVNLLNPSLTTIATASNSVKKSTKFHKILELILAFGNYMNSGKRGAVYGFKLQSLESLIYLKAPSLKNFTLLHYVAQTVRFYFPDLLNFAEEFKFLEKASTISLDSVLLDINELDKSMDLTRKECEFRGKDSPLVLTQFLAQAENKCEDLKRNVKFAQESFRDCAEFYAESPKTLTNSFFAVLLNFSKHFQQADEENVARLKSECLSEKMKTDRVSRQGGDDLRSRHAPVVDELTKKTVTDSHRRDLSRKREPKEMGLGTLDDLISDITSQPYIDIKRQRSIRDQRPAIDFSRKRSYPPETEL